MASKRLTDAEVELEIQSLRQSEHVKLAEKEIRIKQRRRIYLSQLKYLEKRGKQLEAMGCTQDNMEEILFPVEE